MRFRSHWGYLALIGGCGLTTLTGSAAGLCASSRAHPPGRPLDFPSVLLLSALVGFFVMGLAVTFSAAALAVVTVRVRGGSVEWVALGRFVYRRRTAAAFLRVGRHKDGFPALILRDEAPLPMLMGRRELDRLGGHLTTLREAAESGCARPPSPASLNPHCLSDDVRRLAAAAAEGLDPDCPAVLADALEDAGCDDAALLDHLRSPGPHVRGCWAIDLLTGRK